LLGWLTGTNIHITVGVQLNSSINANRYGPGGPGSREFLLKQAIYQADLVHFVARTIVRLVATSNQEGEALAPYIIGQTIPKLPSQTFVRLCAPSNQEGEALAPYIFTTEYHAWSGTEAPGISGIGGAGGLLATHRIESLEWSKSTKHTPGDLYIRPQGFWRLAITLGLFYFHRGRFCNAETTIPSNPIIRPAIG